MSNKELYMSKPWLKCYSEGVPAEVAILDLSVPELFDQIVGKYGEKPALIFYGKKISYRELKELVDRLATALADLGVKKGDTVAIYLLNSPQYVIAYFAALRLGAKVTPISPVYTSIEVKHQLVDSEAKTVVCQDILYDNLDKAGVPLERVILTSIDEYLPAMKKLLGKSAKAKAYGGKKPPTVESLKKEGVYSFQELLKKYPPTPPAVAIDPRTDLAVLPYTGGTTGLPKAAMLTHRNLIALQGQARAFWPIIEEGKEVVMAFLPFFHIYGQVVVMIAGLAQGSTLVLFTTPDIDEILSAMEHYQASGFYGVPTLYEYLKEYEKTDRVNWKRLKLIVCGADTLHESTIDAWEKRTGSQIYEGYGMTETTAVSHSTPLGRRKKGFFGVPLPNIKAAIIEPEGTEFMPLGEVGEMILSGPNIMQGYWKRPESTKEIMLEIDGETVDAHRGSGQHGRGRVFPFLRPQAGPDKIQGILGVRPACGGGALQASADQGRGRRRRARPRGGQPDQGLRGPGRRGAGQGFGRGDHRILLPAPGPLQGAQDRRVQGRAAQDRCGQGLAAGTAGRG